MPDEESESFGPHNGVMFNGFLCVGVLAAGGGDGDGARVVERGGGGSDPAAAAFVASDGVLAAGAAAVAPMGSVGDPPVIAPVAAVSASTRFAASVAAVSGGDGEGIVGKGEAGAAAGPDCMAACGSSGGGGALLCKKTMVTVAPITRTPRRSPAPIHAELLCVATPVVRPTPGRVPADTCVVPACGDTGTARALSDNPAAWMIPEIRSTDALARLGAKGRSARESPPTLG